MTTVAADAVRLDGLVVHLTPGIPELSVDHYLRLKDLFRALVNIEALAKRKQRKGDPDAEHFLRFVADAGLKPLTGVQEVLR